MFYLVMFSYILNTINNLQFFMYLIQYFYTQIKIIPKKKKKKIWILN